MIRLSKTTALAIYGLMSVLVGLDNILDYDTNFAYVQQVLSMDSVFESTALKRRAIESSLVHRAAYMLIILVELGSGALCLGGAVGMWINRHDAARFKARKRVGIAGLLLGLLLWFLGFYVIGGEWFLSWQSEQANSSVVGLRLTMLVLLLLMFVGSRDSNEDV